MDITAIIDDALLALEQVGVRASPVTREHLTGLAKHGGFDITLHTTGDNVHDGLEVVTIESSAVSAPHFTRAKTRILKTIRDSGYAISTHYWGHPWRGHPELTRHLWRHPDAVEVPHIIEPQEYIKVDI